MSNLMTNEPTDENNLQLPAYFKISCEEKDAKQMPSDAWSSPTNLDLVAKRARYQEH